MTWSTWSRTADGRGLNRDGNVRGHRIRDRCHVRGSGGNPLGPCALGAQRQRMSHQPVADREAGHRCAGRGDNAGGFNTERHGRMPPEVPAPVRAMSSQFPTPQQRTSSSTSSGRSSPGADSSRTQPGPSTDGSPLLACRSLRPSPSPRLCPRRPPAAPLPGAPAARTSSSPRLRAARYMGALPASTRRRPRTFPQRP
jgi:hypothetical protein